MDKINVAAVQAAPVLFDKQATIEKIADLTVQAKQQGAELVLFPEAFVPAYPRGFSFGMVVGSRNEEGRALWIRYWNNAVVVPSKDTEQMAKIAKQNQVFLSVGIIEKDGDFGGGTLYCTQIYFSPDGQLLGKHRKLKPTGSERLIWGEGDGSTLPVFDTERGKIGGLTCWENYMPAARLAMYAQGIEIYLAPTADQRSTWQSTMQHIACEGRCFVIGCNQYVTKDMYPTSLETYHELANQPNVMSRGGSVIISPLGDILAGPLWDEEGILVAQLDPNDIVKGKLDFDVVGHYARPDIFQLQVNSNQQPPVKFVQDK
jgi:nitrilase